MAAHPSSGWDIADESEWTFIDDPQDLVDVEEGLAGPSELALLAPATTSTRQISVQNKATGDVYAMILGRGQSLCKGCWKPKGYVELTLMHETQRIGSKWCLACCCVDCHKWVLVESYGGEGVAKLASKGWAKSRKHWRCPLHRE